MIGAVRMQEDDMMKIFQSGLELPTALRMQVPPSPAESGAVFLQVRRHFTVGRCARTITITLVQCIAYSGTPLTTRPPPPPSQDKDIKFPERDIVQTTRRIRSKHSKTRHGLTKQGHFRRA
jgi:hypothetical protein